MIVWRGWGISVLLLFVFWAIAGIVFMDNQHISGYGKPSHDVDVMMQWFLAGVAFLEGLSLFAMVAYRARNPKRIVDDTWGTSIEIPRVDDLFYIPLNVWAWLSLAVAAVLAGLSAMDIGIS